MIATDRPTRVLLLSWFLDQRQRRATTCQHLAAIGRAFPAGSVAQHNAFHGVTRSMRRRDFDVVILHYSILALRWSRQFHSARPILGWLAGRDCAKIAMPQDEYDHSEVLDDWLCELGVTDVFSCFGSEHWPVLYPQTGRRAQMRQVLTGYVDAGLAHRLRSQTPPHVVRPNDIVYRARKLPYWFGSQGQLKHRIADVVAQRGRELGFTCDISTRDQDTIYGNDWFDFLASSRAVIGCESGSSTIDRRGELRARIEQRLGVEPTASFERVAAELPAGWDDHRLFAISPRHLEAAMTRTCQILVEGQYSGLLQADVHYIPLARDFSNLDEALHKLRDANLVASMVERAYADLVESETTSYGGFSRLVAEAVDSKPCAAK